MFNKINTVEKFRYIISWVNVCRKLGKKVYFGDQFENWLKHLELSESDIIDIVCMARTGKFELEQDLEKWFTTE